MQDAAWWEAKYQRGEDGWERGAPNPALLQWVDQGLLAPGAQVLVPGCGRGHEVVELAKRGFAVVGIDFAPSAVQALRARLAQEGLAAEVVESDLFAFQEGPFDAIYEQTCLCALDPARWTDYERWLFARLRPGGLLLALFMQTGAEGGPPFHCDLLAMRRLFAEERWEWPASPPLFSPHPSGRFELGFALRRKAAS